MRHLINTLKAIRNLSIVGIVLFFLLNIYVFNTAQVCEDAHLASYYDKMEAIQTVSSPRILLVGDSNLIFTVDSALMDESFEATPVNMAISDQIGLRFSLESIRPYIQSGDIILLSGQFDQFVGDAENFDSHPTIMLYALLTMRKQDIQHIASWQQIRHVIQQNFDQLGRRFFVTDFFEPDCIRSLGPFFARSEFNNYGDFIGHLGEESLGKDYSHINIQGQTLNPDIVEYLNAYDEFVADLGAELLFVYPAYAEAIWDNSREELLRYHDDLTAQLTFPVIGHPEDYYLSDEMLFNTEYHGTEEGRQLRTETLIRDLQAYWDTEATN